MRNETKTVEDRLIASKGHSTGWDYLRIILAVGVIFVHSMPLSYGAGARWDIPLPVLNFAQALIPMFFALSGFLVTASLIRVPILNFIGLRILRIFPALVVEVVLSALILGPILTTLPLGEYFSNPQFHAYFNNVYGDIHYFLPGVFADNPYPGAVNGSLWTVPFELECYIVIVVLGLFRFVKHWPLMVATVLVASGALYYARLGTDQFGWVDGRMLVLYFAAGVTVFSMRSVIPLRLDLFAILSLFSLYALLDKNLIYLTPLPVAYCTAWIGLRNIPKLPIIFSGDYSYGIYLYGFVVQQTVVHLMPWGWLANSLISVAAVSIFAAFSWHCIEKPTLRLKKYLKSGAQEIRKMPAGIPASSQ